ncbi:hypothetical protein ABGV42_01450 [Paenibacillus pabuli]|uniref:hypothetical protein n=1 Tax=Paenibacillus pabuli TaxID=1472 RepID=UPI0032421BC7
MYVSSKNGILAIEDDSKFTYVSQNSIPAELVETVPDTNDFVYLLPSTLVDEVTRLIDTDMAKAADYVKSRSLVTVEAV